MSLLFSFHLRSMKTSTGTKQAFIGETAFGNQKLCLLLNLKKQNSSMGFRFSTGFKSQFTTYWLCNILTIFFLFFGFIISLSLHLFIYKNVDNTYLKGMLKRLNKITKVSSTILAYNKHSINGSSYLKMR